MQPQEIELTALPEEARRHGLQYLEVCHFQIPSVEKEYLEHLKQSFLRAGLGFHTLLVDYGDISSPDEIRREADLSYIRGWVDVAAKAGATAVRVVAGEQRAGEAAAIVRSCEALEQLAAYGAQLGVRIVTENFRQLTSTVSSWTEIVQKLNGTVPTIIDFGNFLVEEKSDGIAYGASFAHSVHAKPIERPDGSIDAEEFRSMLGILSNRGCCVPVSIIADKGVTRWERIDAIRDLIVL
jgi:sugar phosphate isomerase/epimerase